ncbi:MAG: TrmB family transcriptional regulator [Actinomycetota bacterium]
MPRRLRAEQESLESLGLTSTEASAYLALVQKGPLGAQAVADEVGLSRGAIYPALQTLADKGLVEGGAGYGARFRVVPWETALPSLVDREREIVHEHESVAKELMERLADLAGETGSPSPEVVEVIRNRRAIADRWARLQLEAEEEINVFVKAPILSGRNENPEERAALRRGVRYRALYEGAILDDPEILPYLIEWTSLGEDARVFTGDLPLKLALFDEAAALLPLETPGDRQPVTAIVIRHRALVAGLRILFDCLWGGSQILERAHATPPRKRKRA